jgi:O-succinylbenzoic acid--CoA ligase
MFDLTFDEEDFQIICHPRFNEAAALIREALKPLGLKDHFIIFSSGTTSQNLKGYAISQTALLTNAKAVNDLYQLTASDVWALSLPHFHIGGLSVFVRAKLNGSKIVDPGPWNPELWKKCLENENVTITTIVPTQLFDLVRLKLPSPKTLRYLIVGGDFLSRTLEDEALSLGWPVMRTFGMTEVCSQLASQVKRGEGLKLLPIHQVRVLEDHRLLVKSDALFTLEFQWSDHLSVTWARDLCDSEGFYRTNDLVDWNGSDFRHLGRVDDQIKISGRLVSFLSLKEVLYSYALQHQLYGKIEFFLEEDPRKGKVLNLAHLGVEGIDSIRDEIQERILPVKIEEVVKLTEFNKTDLGKLKKSQK